MINLFFLFILFISLFPIRCFLKYSTNHRKIISLYMKHIENIVSISPGGYKGFYQLGIAKFIKDNYKMNDYLFTGASAGAWISLVMVYKGNHTLLIQNLINWANESKNLYIIQYKLKHKILENYRSNEFDLSRIYIGVVQLNNFYTQPTINIYSDFKTLEEVLECCIASSHIPFITGGPYKKFKNKISFDGGFSNNPYLNNNSTSILHIHPNLWINNLNKINNNTGSINLKGLNDYLYYFSLQNITFDELYVNGYNNAKKNKDKLDKILPLKVK